MKTVSLITLCIRGKWRRSLVGWYICWKTDFLGGRNHSVIFQMTIWDYCHKSNRSRILRDSLLTKIKIKSGLWSVAGISENLPLRQGRECQNWSLGRGLVQRLCCNNRTFGSSIIKCTSRCRFPVKTALKLFRLRQRGSIMHSTIIAILSWFVKHSKLTKLYSTRTNLCFTSLKFLRQGCRMVTVQIYANCLLKQLKNHQMWSTNCKRYMSMVCQNVWLITTMPATTL